MPRTPTPNASHTTSPNGDSPRALPASISWEQLRKQAKELRRAHQNREVPVIERLRKYFGPLRSAADEAVFATPFRLADAQFVIAREYGFASWPKLKAHVEKLNQSVVDEFKSAIIERDVARVRRLLQAHSWLKSHVDAPMFHFGARPLMVARENRELFELLLEHGANINLKSDWWAGGFSLLDGADEATANYLLARGAKLDVFAAAEFGRLDVLRELLDANPELVNAPGPDGQRALHRAKSIEVIDFLLERGAEIDARDVDHNGTPAQYAINDETKLRHLISRSATPDIFIACALGDIELAQRVLQSEPNALEARIGVEPFVAPGEHIYVYELSYTTRPLTLAAQRGHHELTQWLLSHASVKQQFLFACQSADRERIKVLLDAHPNLLDELDSSERALICDAAWNNDAAAVEAMLEAGFDVNARGIHQSTPLVRAALRGYLDTVKVLLKHGADTTVINEFGGTPLRACAWGSIHFRDKAGDYPAVIEALIEAGSTVPDAAFGSEDVQTVMRRHGVPNEETNQGDSL